MFKIIESNSYRELMVVEIKLGCDWKEIYMRFLGY